MLSDLSILRAVRQGYTGCHVRSDETDTEAMYFCGKRCFGVTFRGTEVDVEFSWTDIWTDLRFTPTYSKHLDCWTHRGFRKAARSVWGPVSSRLLKESKKGREIIIAGHSLGGALAVLTAAYCALHEIPVARLVTAGAPRVGFEGLGRWVENIPGPRYVNGSDPVPTIPPLTTVGSWVMPYKHDRPATQLAPMQRTPDIFDWTDHAIDRYVENIPARA